MTPQRGTHWAAGWGRAGVRSGLATSLHLPVVILAIKALPGLWNAYPLLLLPLLLTGPLAARRLPLRSGIGAAALAGVVSACVATVSFAAALLLFGDWYWGLTSAAGAPPMPPLPRITLFPTTLLTWAHQDLLFFQPLLAVLLAVAAYGVRRLDAPVGRMAAVGAPTSLSGRLRLAFGAVITMTMVLGLIGFGMIEDMHMRTHRIQLRADWQQQLSSVRTVLDEELMLVSQTASQPADAADRAARVDTAYQSLASGAPRPGISGGRDDILALLAAYRPLLDRAIAAHAAYRATTDSPTEQIARLAAAISTLGALQQAVGNDLAGVLAGSDLTHHQRLITVMALVGLIAGLGMWMGEHVFRSIEQPMAALGAHVRRVARGDFSRTLPALGPHELRALATSVNEMTADLARLYANEREQRAMAEGVARREHELSAAKEFWTNTLVHDLKNPLTLIAGWTDLLEHGQHGHLTPPQHEAVEQIRQATRMLEDLVMDINDSFRLQAEALPVHRSALKPDDLLRSAVTEYRGLNRAAPDVRIAAGLSLVQADARLVGRVLHNLIGNAYKHGGTHARVTLVAEHAAGGVLFAVDDDGPGIPPAERAHVFGRFMQGSGAARGSGLGLAFCKLVVEQFGGRIWAESSPQGGARLAFELPAAPAALTGRAATVRASQEPAPRRASRIA
jgi:signal transduction histidine kinase